MCAGDFQVRFCPGNFRYRAYVTCARATIMPGQVSSPGPCDDTFARAIARVVVHSSHAVNLPGQFSGSGTGLKVARALFPATTTALSYTSQP